MIESLSAASSLPLDTAGLASKKSKDLKLTMDDVPKSKVTLDALHTEKGKGLKIDIKV